MMLSACSTTPSIQVMSPVIDTPVLKVKPPKAIMTLCEPLITYDSNDTRDVIKITIKNHNLYYLCASKMKSAVMFLNSQPV